MCHAGIGNATLRSRTGARAHCTMPGSTDLASRLRRLLGIVCQLGGTLLERGLWVGVGLSYLIVILGYLK